MSIAFRRVNPAGTQVFMGTLSERQNVHDGIVACANACDIQTATLELLGGLHEIEFTAYDFEMQLRKPPLVLTRALEIVGGHGTLTQLEGKPHVHLHLIVAFRDSDAPYGIVTLGGHVSRALAFAVEFTLTSYIGAPVQRAPHPASGLQLWDLPLLTAQPE